MVIIGEESNVRDRSIYLQLDDCYGRYESFWYVIEERDNDDNNRIEEEIHHKKKKRKQIHDEIRELQPPRIDFFIETLIVFNSRIYIFGGKPEDGNRWKGRSRNVFYFDTTNPEKGWLKGPTLNTRRCMQSVAALENSGVLVAFGECYSDDPLAEFLDASLDGVWCTAPPILDPERRVQINDARLLAVTDTKVYMHNNSMHLGFSFDVQNSEWDIFDTNFCSPYGPGVMLDFCSNSYMFMFATVDIRVYNLNKRTWLPLPVQRLPRDGMVLPDPLKEDDDDARSQIYLLRMNQRNKLALVWLKASYESRVWVSKIYCTKFIIHCTFYSESQHPIFHAEVLSFRSYDVKSSIRMPNCVTS